MSWKPLATPARVLYLPRGLCCNEADGSYAEEDIRKQGLLDPALSSLGANG
jgi:hypothetical protein